MKLARRILLSALTPLLALALAAFFSPVSPTAEASAKIVEAVHNDGHDHGWIGGLICMAGQRITDATGCEGCS